MKRIWSVVVLLGIGIGVATPPADAATPARQTPASVARPRAIDPTSCQGISACSGATADIGPNSCNGVQACIGASGTIGNGSCNDGQACINQTGAIGNGSCNGTQACIGATGTIGNGSCTDTQACIGATGAIGNGSCTGIQACVYNGMAIGDGQCNGPQACAGQNRFVRADFGVGGLEEIGFRSSNVVVNGSFSLGQGPYRLRIRWTPTAPWTPVATSTNSTNFSIPGFYTTPGTRTATVEACTVGTNVCATDTVTIRSSVSANVTPTVCVVDRGLATTPRYQARFGYQNPATYPIYVPIVPPHTNSVAPMYSPQGQPTVFMPGTTTNAFSVGFATGSVTWTVQPLKAVASTTTTRCPT